jgi:hypothetical protein
MKTKAKQTNATVKDKGIKKAIIIGVGLTATGVAGYFGWQYYKKMLATKGKKPSTFSPPNADPIPEYQEAPTSTSQTTQQDSVPSYEPPSTYTPPKSSSSNSNSGNSSNSNSSTYISSNNYNPPPTTKSVFPLKRGSKGLEVRQLQAALIATHGKSILPKYGADGDFGSEMAAALKKLKHPTTVSESLFHVLTAGMASGSASSNAFTTDSIAKQFLTALSKHDYPTTINLLKQIKNKDGYTEVSNEFKTYRVNGGVRQTLVNGTLNAFLDATQKQNIRMEFIRMGLKYNGKAWSLDGIAVDKIITTTPTQIWLDGYNSMLVPSNMILGKPIAKRLDFTLFESEGRHFLVKTKDITNLK